MEGVGVGVVDGDRWSGAEGCEGDGVAVADHQVVVVDVEDTRTTGGSDAPTRRVDDTGCRHIERAGLADHAPRSDDVSGTGHGRGTRTQAVDLNGHEDGAVELGARGADAESRRGRRGVSIRAPKVEQAEPIHADVYDQSLIGSSRGEV